MSDNYLAYWLLERCSGEHLRHAWRAGQMYERAAMAAVAREALDIVCDRRDELVAANQTLDAANQTLHAANKELERELAEAREQVSRLNAEVKAARQETETLATKLLADVKARLSNETGH